METPMKGADEAMSTQNQHGAGASAISLEGVTFQVADVDKALEFYKRIPGTQLVYHRKGEYAILAIGKGQLGLVSRPVPTHVEIDALAVCRRERSRGLASRSSGARPPQ